MSDPDKPESDPELPVLMSSADVEAEFNRAPRTIRRWVERGYLHPVWIGGSIYFHKDEVRRLMTEGLARRIRQRRGPRDPRR